MLLIHLEQLFFRELLEGFGLKFTGSTIHFDRPRYRLRLSPLKALCFKVALATSGFNDDLASHLPWLQREFTQAAYSVKNRLLVHTPHQGFGFNNNDKNQK